MERIPDTTAHRKSLTLNLAAFAELLRASGCRISLSEIIDAANALSRIDVLDKMTFYYTLRTTLVKDQSFFLKFDLLFRQFWSIDQGIVQPREKEFAQSKTNEESGQRSFDLTDSRNKMLEEQNSKNLALYSSAERKSYQRLGDVIPADKLNLMKRLIRRFKRKVATMPGRRKSRARSGEIDLRTSLRRAVSKSGSTIILEKSERRISRSKLIVLADISGSMQNQSDDIFLSLYLFKNVARNSEIFVFSTKLLRLKNITSFSNLKEASREISRQVSIWGSGTRIGECISAFLAYYQSLVDDRSTIVIISDGWDLGDPDTLKKAMLELKEKSARIVWLNPLVKTTGYEPVCIGMKAALDFIDVFAPSDIFLDRELFEAYLGKSIVPSF